MLACSHPVPLRQAQDGCTQSNTCFYAVHLQDKALARIVQRLFASPSMRVNTTSGGSLAAGHCQLSAVLPAN